MYKSLALVPGILLNPDDGTDMMLQNVSKFEPA